MTREAGLSLSFGEVPYQKAWSAQQAIIAARRAGNIPDSLVILRHPPTYTIGRSGSRSNILLSESDRIAAGIELLDVDRGGDATYHGPGQVVGYPIIDLRARGGDVHAHLRAIEDVLIRTLKDFGILGERDEKFTGVWVNQAKIAAIGIKVSSGVTSHGFALNLEPRFDHWSGIIACGIANRDVTSLGSIIGRAPDENIVRERLLVHAADVFDRDWRAPNVPLDAQLIGDLAQYQTVEAR